jgi:hypothetical protein
VFVSVAIIVRSDGESNGAAIEEATHTLVVNAHGAMIGLAARIVKGQLLKVTNCATREEQACRVAYIGPTFGGKVQIGVEFVSQMPDFWRIAFPPEDWASSQVPTGRLKSQS